MWGKLRGRQTCLGESFWGKMEVSNGSKVCLSASFVVTRVLCPISWLCEKKCFLPSPTLFTNVYVHLAKYLNLRRIDIYLSVGRIPIDIFLDTAAKWRGSSPTSHDLSGRNCLNISGGIICPWPILKTKEKISNPIYHLPLSGAHCHAWCSCSVVCPTGVKMAKFNA